MTSVLVLNGPNLNLLGTRKPEVYGTTTLAAVEKLCQDEAGRLGLDLDFRQSNHEGQLIDWIHELGPAVREGRRMRWLDDVLEPVRLRLGRKAWRRLSAALALTLGPDAIVVMKDVCRLGDEEALDVLEWAAGALLRAGLEAADAPQKRPRVAGVQ